MCSLKVMNIRMNCLDYFKTKKQQQQKTQRGGARRRKKKKRNGRRKGGRKKERKGGKEREKKGERERERKESSALAFSHLRCRDIKFLEKLCLKEGPLIGISNSARTGSSRKAYAEQMSRC